MQISASFVRSAATAADLPRDGLAEIAMVGRSNVGKSSLINALTRQRIARTSAAPGKTRLANLYRIAREGWRPFYLVDLPGYGYARGDARELATIAAQYFRSTPGGNVARGFSRAGERGTVSALLLVDARHPGLASDIDAWHWLEDTVTTCALVATKIDKLARGERIRALRELQSVFEDPVLPVSAATGEGLDQLWTLIDKAANNRNSSQRPPSRRPQRATAPPARPKHPKPRE